MATLIQSKQIEGIVTASVIEGQLSVSGSIIATGSDSIFGSITASAISSSGPIYGVRYGDIDGTPNFIAGTGILITQAGDNITITNTGGGGGVSGSAELISSVAQLNSYTGSNDIIILGLNQFTASIQGQVDSLIAATSSYETTGRGIISGSAQITALGFVSSSGDSTPAGTISSSQQITDLGFISSSHTDITSLNAFTASYFTDSASFDSRIDSLTTSTIPAGTISGSQQISDLGFISSSHTDTTQLNQFTSSFSQSVAQDIEALNVTTTNRIDTVETTLVNRIDNIETFTSSIDARVTALEGATDLTGSDSQTLSIVGDQLTISSGNTITIPTGSGSGTSDFTQLTNVPSGLVSSSIQVLGGSGVLSGSHTDISALNQFTASYATDSASFDSRLSGIIETGSVIAPFAFGFVNNTTNGSGTGISWGNWNSSNSTLDFTFTTAQPDTNYAVITDSETFDDYFVGISNKTTTGFRAEFYDNSQSRTPSSFAPFNFIVYGSDPTQTVRVNVSGTDISSLNQFTSSIQSEVDSLTSATSSYLTELPSGLVSGSVLRTLDGSGVLSASVDFNTYSASVATEFQNIQHTQIPQGTISSSTQIESVIDDTYISASAARSGFGSGVGGSHTDISALNQFTSSIQTQVDGLSAQTSSYLTELPSGVLSGSIDTIPGFNAYTASALYVAELYSASVATTIDNIVHTSIPQGTISSSQQITDLGFVSQSGDSLPSGTISGSSQLTSSFDTRYALSGSGGSSDVSYNGNRVISNEDLGDLFTNQVNPGTSGSIQDFLNAVFYPNSAPTITTGNQTIAEYSASNAQIVTLSATDPEGQSLTFGTASSYTDDLVRVSSAGVMTLNALAESSSFNTDSVGGVHGHLVTVTATDTFGTSVEKDIYIIVTPNSTPVFRESSTGGNVITSVTANLNENSTDNTLVKRVYFTDANGDSITIYSSSIDNNHFDITKYSTYVDIRQNTSSLDYEQQTQYTFSISASDEHYELGQDSDSIVTLPITINVTDNLTPTISDQTLSSINENSSNGASVGSISATDNESDTITFKNFQLHQLQLDGVVVPSGSYSGTSQLTDPHENPFQMDSSGNVTRKTGVNINSDLINKYIYRVQVTDGYNGDSNVGLITINITDDTPATISDNWSSGPFIKESELSGTTIKTTNYGSTTADYNSNQSGTWSSSNPAISINSNGNLSLGVDLSGSVTQSGDTLDSTITFTNTFGTTTTDNLSVTIIGNSAPTATFSNQSSNFNTNLATNGTNLVSVTISDTESDSPYELSLSGTDASSFNAVPQNAASSSWQLQANGNLSAGTYNYDVTVTDSYSKSTTYSGRSFTIAQATTGSLSVSNAYVIESATNGDQIKRAVDGRTGNQSYVSVAYSPDYGSQSATSFASSNNLISINSSTGYLSVGNDISGSGNVAGDTITTTITWTDQYGNVGSSDIDITVTENYAPLVNTQTFNTNTNQATGSSTIVKLLAYDVESDSVPFSGLSWSGYNTTYFTESFETTTLGLIQYPTMNLIVNSTSVPAGTYPYTASLQDEHGFSTRVVSGSVTISQADTGTLGGDTSIYIIESAQSGVVFRDATGYNQGNAAQLSVSYSPSYGSPVVQSYTSSNEAIVVDSSGNLTLGVDISGSVTQSGDTFTSTITFTDQYGNVGSGSVTATVFGNSTPSANFTAASFNTDEAISGSNIGTVTVTDTENNSPFTLTLGGTDGGKFDVSGSSSPFTIQPTGSLEAGSYSINITVTDTYGESVTLTNESITVTAAEVLTNMYVYTLPIDGTYDNVNGITANGSGVPPTPTISTAYGFFTSFVDSDTLGDSAITVSYGTNYTATRRAIVSGSSVDTALDSVQMSIGSSERVYIFIPSGSETLGGVPTRFTTADPGTSTTAGEYILFVSNADSYQTTFPTDVRAANIHKLTLDTAVDGYTDWFVVGTNDRFNAGNNTLYLRMIPSSGSTPS